MLVFARALRITSRHMRRGPLAGMMGSGNDASLYPAGAISTKRDLSTTPVVHINSVAEFFISVGSTTLSTTLSTALGAGVVAGATLYANTRNPNLIHRTIRFFDPNKNIDEEMIHLAATKNGDIFSSLPAYVDINYRNSELNTALHCAIHAGHTRTAREIIARNPNFSLRNRCGRTAFYDAVARGNIAVADSMIHQILYGQYDPKIYRTLFTSYLAEFDVANDEKKKLMILCEIASIDSKKHWTTLCASIAYKHTSMSMRLLHDLESMALDMYLPESKRSKRHLQESEFFRNRLTLASPHRRNLMGQTAFYWAVKVQSLQLVRRLAETKAEIGGINFDGSNVFHMAAKSCSNRSTNFERPNGSELSPLRDDSSSSSYRGREIFDYLLSIADNVPCYSDREDEIRKMINSRVGEERDNKYELSVGAGSPSLVVTQKHDYNIVMKLEGDTQKKLRPAALVKDAFGEMKLKLEGTEALNRIRVHARRFELESDHCTGSSGVIDIDGQRIHYWGKPTLRKPALFDILSERIDAIFIKKSDLHGRTPFQIICLYSPDFALEILRDKKKHAGKSIYDVIDIEETTLSGRDLVELLTIYNIYPSKSDQHKTDRDGVTEYHDLVGIYEELLSDLKTNFFYDQYSDQIAQMEQVPIEGRDFNFYKRILCLLAKRYLIVDEVSKSQLREKVVGEYGLVNELVKKIEADQISCSDFNLAPVDKMHEGDDKKDRIDQSSEGYTIFHFLARFNNKRAFEKIQSAYCKRAGNSEEDFFRLMNQFDGRYVFGNVLFDACVFRCDEMIDYLTASPVVDIVPPLGDPCQMSPLLGAALSGKHDIFVDLFEILQKRLAESSSNAPKLRLIINSLSYSGRSAMTYLIENLFRVTSSDAHSQYAENIVSLIERLLKAGACVNNIRDLREEFYSADFDNPHYADNDFKRHTDYFEPPLLTAVRTGHQRVIKLLLRYGASTAQTNVHGSTALHIACLKNDLSSARLLVNGYAASVNAVNEDGMKPIDLCGCAPKYADLKNYLKVLMNERSRGSGYDQNFVSHQTIFSQGTIFYRGHPGLNAPQHSDSDKTPPAANP